MAIRRLFTMLSALAGGDNPQAIRSDTVLGRGPTVLQDSASPSAVGLAQVVAVGPFATVVDYRGRIEVITSATDEPFRVGENVWVAPVKGGGLVALGSQK